MKVKLLLIRKKWGGGKEMGILQEDWKEFYYKEFAPQVQKNPQTSTVNQFIKKNWDLV